MKKGREGRGRETDEIEIELFSLDLARVLLGLVVQSEDVLLAKGRVVVELNFRVERDHLLLRGQPERIDFHLRLQRMLAVVWPHDISLNNYSNQRSP